MTRDSLPADSPLALPLPSTGERSTLLIWCQHSVGLGHLVRTLALADGFTRHFDVVVLNGGPMPDRIAIPDGVRIVNLPPLGHGDGYDLVSRDPELDLEAAQRRRIEILLDTLRRTAPTVVVIELFPFGRKKFAFELDPFLQAIGERGEQRPLVVCSIRDILVNQRRDQARHDERAAVRCNADFDAVLVHSDPAFARLEESFRPVTPLTIPVFHTGFVTSTSEPAAPSVRRPRMIVSAGGGMVGEPLFRAAVDAHRDIHRATGLTTTIVAGPFLPEPAWNRLLAEAAQSDLLEVVRHVDDLTAEIAASAASVSQCGYNTTMDLLRAGTPAVVVPYSEGKEDEQRRRARRLHDLGVLHLVEQPDADAITSTVRRIVGSEPPRIRLDLRGRATSADIVTRLATSHPSRPIHRQGASVA